MKLVKNNNEEQKTKIVSDKDAEEAFKTILKWIGEDPEREGLLETPKRVVKAFKEYFKGYREDPNLVLDKTFGDVEGYDDMVVQKNISVQSHCEHHMAPIIGKAHVAYIPRDRVVGLSKLARVVEVFSKRLQTQERLTMQIANTLMKSLDAKGVAVTIDSTHQCMTMRGIKKEQASTVTNYYLGQFKEDLSYQNRYLRFISTKKIKVSDQFKALILNQEGEKFTREVKSIDKSFLKHGDVTIKVDYSDLNFKDGMILKNGGRLVKEFPHIPGIDFSGTVLESENSKFKSGDEVILTGFRVGEIFYGGYSQIAKVNGDFLVKKPNNLTTKQAMILGTAGFTSLMAAFAIKAREEILLGEKVKNVLVTGASGGVGSIAVMILNKMGYEVTAVSGKESKADYLKSLGAKNVINRAEFDKDPKLIDKGLWDGVVDTVGGKILANAIVQTNSNGIIAVCGNASTNELNTNVIPFMLRGIKLWGMDSANCSIRRREFIWGEASKLIDFDLLENSIQTVNLEELIETYPKILKGEISGRVLVDLNK